VAIQRASHKPAMAVHVRNATDDPISFSVLSTRDPITFASMKEAIHDDSVITIQHFPTAGGFIAQANEIPFSH
jgi:hypothetical protein